MSNLFWGDQKKKKKSSGEEECRRVTRYRARATHRAKHKRGSESNGWQKKAKTTPSIDFPISCRSISFVVGRRCWSICAFTIDKVHTIKIPSHPSHSISRVASVLIGLRMATTHQSITHKNMPIFFFVWHLWRRNSRAGRLKRAKENFYVCLFHFTSV